MAPFLVCSNYFSSMILCVWTWHWPQTKILLCTLPCSCDRRCTQNTDWDGVLITFCQGRSWTTNLPISTSWIAVSYCAQHGFAFLIQLVWSSLYFKCSVRSFIFNIIIVMETFKFTALSVILYSSQLFVVLFFPFLQLFFGVTESKCFSNLSLWFMTYHFLLVFFWSP
jgi:hypothetical protein